MRLFSITVLSSALFLAARSACAEPVEVEVFSNDHFPVAGIERAQKPDFRITTYNLDAPARLAKEFGAGLPGALGEAKALAMANIDEIKRRFREAYGGQFKAFGWDRALSRDRLRTGRGGRLRRSGHPGGSWDLSGLEGLAE